MQKRWRSRPLIGRPVAVGRSSRPDLFPLLVADSTNAAAAAGDSDPGVAVVHDEAGGGGDDDGIRLVSPHFSTVLFLHLLRSDKTQAQGLLSFRRN